MLKLVKSFFAERERQRKIRSTIDELSKLSTKELHDIGISRGDIYSIAHSAH